jgi:nitronate monooxygenase/enoyl-[acyl-carrier protein] reductase II
MRTPFCDVVGVDLPIVLAPFGPWDQVELAVAVCEAGGLGSLGTAIRSPDQLRDQWARMRAVALVARNDASEHERVVAYDG